MRGLPKYRRPSVFQGVDKLGSAPYNGISSSKVRVLKIQKTK